MGNKLVFKSLVALVFVACAVVWLLSVLQPEWFNGFNFSWLLGIVPAVIGALLICAAFLSKTVSAAKKLYIVVGAGLLVAAVFAFVGSLITEALVLPIIAVIVSVALLLCIFVVGGKAWDEGDNHKAGYKNYYERKKEEEKNNK